ncbi:MAG TPA: hypothetical protein VF584_15745 [Longimicrobium sp.]
MRSTPTPSELLLPRAEANFRMSGTELRALPAALDGDAVQELLSWIRPEHREPTIALLQEVGKRGNSVPIVSVDASHPELAQIARRLWKRPDRPVAPDSTIQRDINP